MRQMGAFFKSQDGQVFTRFVECPMFMLFRSRSRKKRNLRPTRGQIGYSSPPVRRRLLAMDDYHREDWINSSELE